MGPPRGYVEPGESPKQAARREVREELGIEPSIGRLLAVDWAPHPNEGDKLLFIFAGDQLAGDPPQAASEEIERAQFWPPDNLIDALPARLLDRIASALHVNGDVYLEHGTAAEPQARMHN